MNEVIIASAVRTAIGSFGGALSSLSGPKIGAVAIKGALEKASVKPEEIDEVIMGMVLQGGVGQAPARQASIFAGVPNEIGATTVHKVCGSGLKSVMLGTQAIRLGDSDVVVAGGMESMSNAPYYMLNVRNGLRLGNDKIVDGMIHDGLWDPYNDMHMGMCGEVCAEEYKISREAQDEFTIESYKRAIEAQKAGKFDKEIVPVEIPQRKGESVIFNLDEEPNKVKFDKIPTLKPAFKKDGTITAANASKLNDGASALVLMSGQTAEARSLKPLAKIHGYAAFGQAPVWFTTSPAGAIKKAIEKTRKSDGSPLMLEEIDLFEINEAFSVVGLVNIQLLGLDSNKVNINGGAVALGHPIGASGARILTTLVHSLHDKGMKWGVAAICLGGGEAVAVVVERI